MCKWWGNRGKSQEIVHVCNTPRRESAYVIIISAQSNCNGLFDVVWNGEENAGQSGSLEKDMICHILSGIFLVIHKAIHTASQHLSYFLCPIKSLPYLRYCLFQSLKTQLASGRLHHLYFYYTFISFILFSLRDSECPIFILLSSLYISCFSDPILSLF